MNRGSRLPRANELATLPWPPRQMPPADPAVAQPLEPQPLPPSRQHASNESEDGPSAGHLAAGLLARYADRRGWKALRPLKDDPQFNERFVRLVHSGSQHYEGFVPIALAPGELRIGYKSLEEAMPMRRQLGARVPDSMLASSTKAVSEADVAYTRLLLKTTAFAEMLQVALACRAPDLPAAAIRDIRLDAWFGAAEAAWTEARGLMPAARAEYTLERLHEACRP